jgi:bleomycin hydrolase
MVLCGLFFASDSIAQDGYKFQEIKRLPATPVKAQGKTGTCWVFATLSMLESELIRMDKGEFDLSEMFIVRQSYLHRAGLYMRFHGHLNFGPGAQAWDVINVVRDFGLVPQQALPGFLVNKNEHNHLEMDALLKSYMNTLLENKNQGISPVWKDGYRGILDAYLGKYPDSFTVNEESYTPASYLEYLGIQADNYLPFTSFLNHPYYSGYVFESPDNWSMETIYNLPLDVLVHTMKEAIRKGHTVAWAADVSDPGFRSDKGLAIVPKTPWKSLSAAEQASMFEQPVVQREITEEMRQRDFNDFSTTDDHLMHIVGLAKDQLDNTYFIVKNSWGTQNPFGGYLYVSEAYVKLRTTSIILHKNALSDEVIGKFSF